MRDHLFLTIVILIVACAGIIAMVVSDYKVDRQKRIDTVVEAAS